MTCMCLASCVPLLVKRWFRFLNFFILVFFSMFSGQVVKNAPLKSIHNGWHVSAATATVFSYSLQYLKSHAQLKQSLPSTLKEMHNFKCTHMWWLTACLFLRCMKRQRASCPCRHRRPHLHVLTFDSLLCVPAEAWVNLNSTLWSPYLSTINSQLSLNSHWPNTHTSSLQPHILSSWSLYTGWHMSVDAS